MVPSKKQPNTIDGSIVAKSPIMDSMKPAFKSAILRLIKEDEDIQNAIKSLQINTVTKRKSNAITQNKIIIQPSTDQYKKSILEYLKNQAIDALQYEEFVNTSIIDNSDLDYILEHGFIDGFVYIIKKNLDNLDPACKPIYSFNRDYSAIFVKITTKNWKRETTKLENLSEIVFGFSQKIDLKIAEICDKDQDYINRLRKHASGGIDRIRFIEEVCKKIADICYIDLSHMCKS